jgi:uncharacterized membrane protein
MVKSRRIRLVFSLFLMVSLVAAVILAQTPVFAADATPTSPSIAQPTLVLDSTYPVISADSGQSFTFNVNIKYAGYDKKTFDLALTAPPGWTASCTAGYPVAQISAIQIISTDITTPVTQSVTVNVTPDLGNYPEPGNYTATLKVSSGDLSQTIDLRAIVRAKYEFALTTATGNLATQATAGDTNHFSFEVINTGSATLEKLNLTSTNPEGWVISFTPSSVESLGAGQTSQVDAVITPPQGKTIAGDYMINFKADTGSISQDMDVRVTVLTPTIWGWVGIIVIVVVIAGLAVLFMKLGRR